MVKLNITPVAAGTPVSGPMDVALGGEHLAVEAWRVFDAAATVHAGRLNTLDFPVSDARWGESRQRADGGHDLRAGPANPLDFVAGRSLIRAETLAQKRGFSSGEHYWLAQDAQGNFMPEPGRNHRKIYVSGSAVAMNAAAVASHAGVSAGTVTGAWLAARPIYGGSEGMAVTYDLALLITAQLWGSGKSARSDWLLYERGYEYPGFARPSTGNSGYMRGESELHPLVYGAWGRGTRPVINATGTWFVNGPAFVLFRDLAARNFALTHCYGIAIENCILGNSDSEGKFDQTSMMTLKNTVVEHVAKETPGNGRTNWDGSQDRVMGFYASQTQGVLVDGCLIDHNGWAAGYDYNRARALPMPPSDRNHGLYFQYNCRDVTVRHSFISRNASCGAQIRSGGFYDRNLFVDNNIAGGLQAGTAMGPVCQFNILTDNVVYSAGYKLVNGFQGAYNWGLDVNGQLRAMIGNVIAHRADPDNAAEIAAKPLTGRAYNKDAANSFIHNDTQVWAWDGTDEGVAGLDPAVLNQTTIQRYAGSLTGQTFGTIADLVDLAKAAGQIGDFVEECIRWTKARFGTPLPDRIAPAGLTFLPDDRAEGFRWDNRLNWSTLDLPGTHVADSVDLDGNFVRFGALTTDIAALTSGGGTLDVTSGRLTVGTMTDDTSVIVRNSGQFWCGASAAGLDIHASSGRANLTGAIADLNLTAAGRTEVLLGPNCTIPASRSLVVSGNKAQVGWDGAGPASLTIAGRLEFQPGMVLNLTGTTILHQWIRTGTRIVGNTSGFQATIGHFEQINATGRVWLHDVTGTPQTGETFMICVSENVMDTSDVVTERLATVSGIHSAAMPVIAPFRSGIHGLAEPSVTATLTLAAGAQVVVDTAGLPPGTHALTGAGVTVVDQGATLPEGVAVTEGKMVVVVS